MNGKKKSNHSRKLNKKAWRQPGSTVGKVAAASKARRARRHAVRHPHTYRARYVGPLHLEDFAAVATGKKPVLRTDNTLQWTSPSMWDRIFRLAETNIQAGKSIHLMPCTVSLSRDGTRGIHTAQL